MKLMLQPDPVLQEICQPVEKVTSELAQLAKDMYTFMLENKGLGLASNQIGQTMRLIVIDNNGKPLYMFNPKIRQQVDKCVLNEGCLSSPGVFKNIKRARSVTMSYRDINNKIQFAKFDGMVARTILHEIEHLNGQSFLDHEEVNDGDNDIN